jgi:hypothetical protein
MLDLFGSLVSTGWIAPGPAGAEEAFLLLGAVGDGMIDPEIGMRAAADSLGAQVGAVRELAGTVAVIDKALVLQVALQHAGVVLCRRLVTAEWVAIAVAAGRIVLVLTLDPLPETPAPVEAVTDHPERCAVGLVPVTDGR